MANKPNLTPDELRQLLSYDPDTGFLTWRTRDASHLQGQATMDAAGRLKKWNTRYAGKRAFSLDKSTGYISGHVLERKWYAHRIAWAIFYGVVPDREVDHINGDRTDNRLCNLRLAYHHENQHNRKSIALKQGKPPTSSHCGVYFSNRRKRWIAKIRCFEVGKGSVQHHLGYHRCETSAAIAYNRAAKRLHGEFANLNG